MQILFLVLNTPTTSEAYDTTALSFQELKQSITSSLHITAVCKEGSTTYVVDFSRILLQRPEVTNAANWAAVATALTANLLQFFVEDVAIPAQVFTMVGGKKVAKPNGLAARKDSINIVSSSHANISTSYGSIYSPSVRNIPTAKHRLKDVIFTLTDLSRVNLNNSIPVINGRVYRPIIFNKEMYVKDATKSLKSAKPGALGTMLIDFSHLGDTTTVPFSDCIKISDTVYSIPSGLSMTNKTVLVVAGGRFFFPGEFQKITAAHLDVAKIIPHLERIDLSNKAIENSYTKHTPNISEDASTPHFTDIGSDDFIVLINAKDVSFIRQQPLLEITPFAHRYPAKSGGLLIRKLTREIIDYSRQEESDATVIFLPDLAEFSLPALEDAVPRLAYKKANGAVFAHDALHASRVGYELLSITR